MKNKYAVLLCAAVLAAGLTACGGQTGESGQSAGENTQGSSESGGAADYDPVTYEDLASTVVSLGPYKGLEAQRVVEEVTDETVQKEINAIKKEYSQLVTVDRPAQEGDVALINFTGYVDGETSEGLQGTEYYLELGSGEMVPGFEDQLIGASADESREVAITFPEDYYPEMAGKDAVFDVYVAEVQEYVLEDWGDAFVQENLGYDSIEDMESSIRTELEQGAEADAEMNLQYALVEKFLSGCEFEIQDSDVEAYIDEMMSEYETYATMYGMELSEFLDQALGMTAEQLRENFRETANFRVQMTLAFHQVAEEEGIMVSEEEYQEQLQTVADQYGYEDPAEVEAVYNRDMMEEQMIQDKVISLIVENAVIS